MTRRNAAMSLLLHRLTRRFEFKASVTITLVFVLVAFAETCLHFFGADVGDLPSPAYAWAWNMDAMQSNAMRVFLYFFMPVAAALVFSGCARDEIDCGMASCVAARSSLRSYMASHMVLAYLGGFLLVFAMLLVLQLLACVAFPFDGTYGGYLDTPLYIETYTADGLLSGIRMSSPYLYNFVFAVWSSAWAGACSLISFALSLLMGKHKTVALVAPTLVSLALFQFAPLVSRSLYRHLHFVYCYPAIAQQDTSLVLFILMPVALTAAAVLLACVPLRRGKDVLL